MTPRSLEKKNSSNFFGHGLPIVALFEFTYMFQVLAKVEIELYLRLPNVKKKDKHEVLADDEKNKHY
jgi:hypothetical protein